MRTRRLKKPQKIDTDPAFGPRPPIDWTEDSMVSYHPAWAAAVTAVAIAKAGNNTLALERVDFAYGSFADAAEEELILTVGQEVTVKGLRGRPPKEVWGP